MNTLIQEHGSTKTHELISIDERSIVNTHSIDITAKLAVVLKNIKIKFLPYIGYQNFINELIKHVSLLVLVHVPLLFSPTL